jgi:beta-glucosidase
VIAALRPPAAGLLLLGLLLSACSSEPSPSGNGSGSIAQKVNTLLHRMTLQEKVGQMTQISVSRLWGDCQGSPGALNDGCMHALLGETQVGSVLSGGGEAPQPNTPRSWADMTNAIQRYAIRHSRLHIPVLYGADAVHGHNNVLGATIFPHNIGMAATWDPSLVREVGAATAADMLATGVHWDFAPVSDVARDLRWGRYYETYGEDPTLAAAMVWAEVRGLEGDHFSTHVASTAKHFVGYSGPITGHDRTVAEIPYRDLEDTYLPPFAADVKAGTAAVMADSGSVNGVPVHASHYLLTTVLRHQLHFTGFVVSDWQDIESLYDRYHVAASYDDAIRMAINAGVDMSMVPYQGADFSSRLVSLVRAGKVPQSRIDQAVRRILTVKYELGLFRHPYVNAAAADASVGGAHQSLALRAAGESMTLLKNDGVLPLRSTHAILVAGSVATSVADQMGGWTIGWQGVPSGSAPPATTILQGIKSEAPSGTRVTFADESDPKAAASAARRAGVAVVVVGEHPYAEGPGDTETAGIPSPQRTLFDAVAGTGVPTVLVVVAGRPLMISDLIHISRATLMAWLPGTEGGKAVADVLFGRRDPSGRLAASWPQRIGQVPLVYTAPPTTNANPAVRYDPLFPFGFGLSYTSFQYSALRSAIQGGRGGTLRVSVTVANTGSRSGDDVVEIFDHPLNLPVLVPPRRLIGFARVHLTSGERKTVTVSIPMSRLSVVAGDVLSTSPPSVLPGSYQILAGGQSTTVIVR